MSATALRILLAARPGIAGDLNKMLRRARPERFVITPEPSISDALARLQREEFDVLLLDLSSPGAMDPEALRRLNAKLPRVPVVAVTRPGREELGAEVRGLGVQDFLVSDGRDGRELARVVRHAVERARVEEALRRSKEDYRRLFESMLNGVVYQDATGRVRAMNPAAERILGWSREEFLGETSVGVEDQTVRADGSPFPGAEHPAMVALRTGREVRDVVMGIYNPRERARRWILISAVPLFRPGEDKPHEVFTVFDDVTERRGREAELARLNRTLKALSDSNQAIMRAKDEDRYLRDVCRIIVKHCGHRMVWIGFAEDDAAKSIRPVAHAGFDAGYIRSLRLTWADAERGRGPTGTAIRTGKPAGCRDMLNDPGFAPWRPAALRRGYASSLAVPLRTGGRVFGAITLYSREPDGFTAEDVQLLSELADDMSHGIAAFRMRAAREEAEEALRLERDFISAVLDTAGAVVVVFDREGRIMRLNRAGEQLTGYRAIEVLGRPVWDLLIPPEDLPAVKQAWAAIKAGDFPNRIENHWLTKAGNRRLLAWSNTALVDRAGAIRHVIATGIDVTERRQAEQEARDREDELAAIYDHAPLLILLVDDQLRIRKANRHAEQFARVRSGSLRGGCAGEALRCRYARLGRHECGTAPFCRRCALRRALSETLAGARAQSQLEVTLPLLAGGKERALTFLASTRRLDLRGQSLALVTLQDITARKQAEEVVRRARAELEQRVIQRTAQLRALTAELTQSEVRERRRIATVLHDQLQQLLAAARLRVETARRRPDPAAREKDLRRTEQLLDESNQVARDLSHELSPVVLHERGLVAGLRWLARWMRDKHELAVRVHADDGAGGLAHDVSVLLYECVRELLFNAVKHAAVRRAVVRLGPRDDGWFQVQVSDRGRGFVPSRMAAARRGGGGLGLFGIRERLTFIGGRMEIESRPGAGCRTRLLVPLREAPGRGAPERPRPVHRADGRLEPAPSDAGAATRRPRRPAIRVLLADDHRLMRDGLAASLRLRPGIEVVGLASDGREAIDLAATLQPQIAIMDVGMPRVNGVEATRQITAAWPNIKVIGLTMHADRATHDAMCAAGAVDCLVKTGRTSRLIRAIRAASSRPTPPACRRRRTPAPSVAAFSSLP